MAVTLHDQVLAVCLINARTVLERTRISAQTHRAALGRDALLLLHKVDNGVLRALLHLARMRIGQAQNIACELYDGALHTQTYSEERDLVLACITHGLDLALDAAVAEARSHHDTCHAAQRVGNVLGSYLLRINIRELHLAVVRRTRVYERLADRLVGIGQLGVLAHQSDLDLVFRMLDLIHKLAP